MLVGIHKLSAVLRSQKEILIDILVILVLGFLSLTWFKGSLVNAGDFNYTLDWHRLLRLSLTLWDEYLSFGLARVIGALLPISVFGAFLQTLGFSPLSIEKIFFYSWFAGGGISMYLLGTVLGLRRIGKMAAAIIYMFNPFSLIIIWRISHGSIQLPYAFAPLFLAAYIFGIKEGKGLRFIILVITGLFLLTGSAYINVRSALIHFIPVFIYFLYFFISEKKKRFYATKYTFLFFLWLFLLSFYWIFPFIFNLETNLDAHLPALMSDVKELKLTSVGLLGAIRMLGYWSLPGGYKGDPYYPYWQYYNSFWIMAISWLIPVLVILGFFDKEIRRKRIRFFYLASIFFGLWAIKGTLPPLEGLSEWIYKHVPYLTLAARFSFLLYGLPTYLIFCVMIGYGFSTIYDFGFKKIKRQIYLPLLTLLFLLAVVLVLPFWTGEVIGSTGKSFPGERLKLPEYWEESRKWLNEQHDFFRIFPLPMSKTYNTAEFWGEGYAGVDMVSWLSEHPALWNNTKSSFRVPEAVGELIEKESSFKEVAKILGFLNVKYFLYRLDTRWDFLRGHTWQFAHNPQNIEKFLDKQNGLTLEKEIGKFKFYKVDSKYILPQVYIPNKVAWIEGKPEGMVDLAGFLSPEEKEGILFSEQNQGLNPESFSQNLENILVWQEPIKEEENYNPQKADYQINIPVPGDYEIFLRDDNFLDYYDKGALSFSLDGEKITPNKLEISGNLIRLGKQFLKKGNRELTLFLPEPKNLVSNLGLERTSWQSVEFLSTRSKEAEISVLPEEDTGKNYLSLSVGGNQAVVFSPIINYRLGDNYRILFSLKHLQGNQPVALIWQNDDNALTPHWNPVMTFPQFGTADPYTSLLPIDLPVIDSSWQNFQFFFKPQNALAAGLAFLGEPSVGQGLVVGKTQNLYRGVRVERIFTSPLILKLVSSESQRESLPQLSFKKINSTEYEINIQNAKKPFFLVLSEAFDKGWKVSGGEKHLRFNSFANGWEIDKTGDFQLKIYYAPQKILVFSEIFSALFLFASLIYVIIPYLKKCLRLRK